jgi:hypothetical protein
LEQAVRFGVATDALAETWTGAAVGVTNLPETIALAEIID